MYQNKYKNMASSRNRESHPDYLANPSQIGSA